MDSEGFNSSSGNSAAVGSWATTPSTPTGSEITWKAVASLKQVNSEGAWAVDASWSVSRWSGDKGDDGNKGPIGTLGEKGITGTAGDKGPVGPDGTEGPKGITGTRGTVGLKGNNGSPGADAPYVVIGFDAAINTAAERIAAIKSFSGLTTVLANSVYWDAVTGIPYQNQGVNSATPTLTALTGGSGIVSMDSIKLGSGTNRVELTSGGMKIYNSNILRVKIGDLA